MAMGVVLLLWHRSSKKIPLRNNRASLRIMKVTAPMWLLWMCCWCCCGTIAARRFPFTTTGLQGHGRFYPQQHHSLAATLLAQGDGDAALLQIEELEEAGDEHEVLLTPTAVLQKWIEQAVGRQPLPSIDFSGTVPVLVLGLLHPLRVLRSVVLSWVAAELVDRCGWFRKRRPKKKIKYRPGNEKRYRRVTTTVQTHQRQVKGLIEEDITPAVDERMHHSQQSYAVGTSGSRHRGTRDRKSGSNDDDVFGGLVPESQRKGRNLTKNQEEELLKKFEVKSRPKTTFKFPVLPKLTRKRKFGLAWALGHLASPLVQQTAVGSAVAGWMLLLCATAELVPWVERKYFRSSILEENEVVEGLLGFFQGNEVLSAVLLGVFVGGAGSSNNENGLWDHDFTLDAWG